jgi:hypothetical protein
MNNDKLDDYMVKVYDFLESPESYTQDYAAELFRELTDIVSPVYCNECGACGHGGCCPPTQCLHFEAYLDEHEWLENDWKKQYDALIQANELAGFRVDVIAESDSQEEPTKAVSCRSGESTTKAPELAEWLEFRNELYAQRMEFENE